MAVKASNITQVGLPPSPSYKMNLLGLPDDVKRGDSITFYVAPQKEKGVSSSDVRIAGWINKIEGEIYYVNLYGKDDAIDPTEHEDKEVHFSSMKIPD